MEFSVVKKMFSSNIVERRRKDCKSQREIVSSRYQFMHEYTETVARYPRVAQVKAKQG